MKNLIRYSIYSLVLGTVIATLGATGSISIKADALKESSPILFEGSMIGVIIGAVLIVIAIILFLVAIAKAEK